MVDTKIPSKVYGKSLDACDASELSAILGDAAELLAPFERKLMFIAMAKEVEEDRIGPMSMLCISLGVVFSIAGLFYIGVVRSTDSILLGIVFIILSLLSFNFSRRRRLSEASREETRLTKDKWCAELYSYVEDKLRGSIVGMIPSEFQRYVILITMKKYLENNQASNWQECVAAWKAESRRAKRDNHVASGFFTPWK